MTHWLWHLFVGGGVIADDVKRGLWLACCALGATGTACVDACVRSLSCSFSFVGGELGHHVVDARAEGYKYDDDYFTTPSFSSLLPYYYHYFCYYFYHYYHYFCY